MINFDFLTLNLFLEENIDFLLGARLQKIQQPTRQELVLNIRNQSENKKLYININPMFFHVCFMSSQNEKKRLIEIPKQPPMFCMLLRKYLEGVKIVKINQPQNERILEFYFEAYNEISEKIYLCLAIELMGKHSNVIIYNYDTNVIIGCMHNVGSDKSRERELIGGLPYTYPPKKNNARFTGFSSLLNSSVSVNDSIDNHFATLQEKEKIKSVKSKLFTIIKSKIKKNNSTLDKIANQTTNETKNTLYRKKGDLIMSNLFDNEDFSPFIEVFDYEINSLLKIELDNTKTLKENANQYFKLYNKTKNSILKSMEMQEHLEIEKKYLEQILYSIENADKLVDLIEIEDELTPKSNLKTNKTNSLKNQTSILTINKSPFTIYIGKNNKQNDYIVSKIARDEDLWFHTRNCAGSHVLLKTESGQKINEKIIFECAKLAKEHSAAKNSSKVEVIYTLRKFIKKPTGANLGYVIYKEEKSILVE